MLALLLRLSGASLIVLSLFHGVLGRVLDWKKDTKKLTPLNARIFAVHTFFIAFVLLMLGLLSFGYPRLLLDRSDLARLLLGAVVLFWVLRLVIQPLIFDPVMRQQPGEPRVRWEGTWVIRGGNMLLWIAYIAVYGAAFLRQWRHE